PYQPDVREARSNRGISGDIARRADTLNESAGVWARTGYRTVEDCHAAVAGPHEGMNLQVRVLVVSRDFTSGVDASEVNELATRDIDRGKRGPSCGSLRKKD